MSSRFPDEPGEAFLSAELEALRPCVERLAVLPALPGATAYHPYKGEVVRIPVAGAATLVAAVRTFLRRPGRALAALRDILFAPGRLAHRLKNLAIYPKGLAIGAVLARERFDHVHAYWLSAPATLAMVAARTAGITWSATGHRWDIYDDNFLALKAKRATAIRTISSQGKDAVCARVAPLDRARIDVVPLGVTIPEAIAVPPPREELVVLCAAELRPVKGHAILLDALARAREMGVPIRAVLAGIGPLEEEIRAQIARLGLDRCVRLEGYVSHGALLERIVRGEFDAVVLASIAQGDLKEGIPVILIEAMAAGVPVVATKSGAIPELLEPSRGTVVPCGDAVALANAFVELARDPTRGRSRSASARAFVRERYDARQTATALLEHIRR
ncbi:MAG: glycosyltransferase [Candidatus Eremiobacteraeota bacterium]|nr:glycosyltransferase [Candidatus Eremiobacteraeota bacterium]